LLVFLIAAIVAASATPARGETPAVAKPQAALYFFAHEDDEIDIAIKIVADMRAGKDVYCVWATDGGRGGEPAARQKESRAVMELLGVPQDRLFFLGYPDQGAYKHLRELVGDLSKLVEKIAPTDIMSHAYEGGNIDHDSVSFVASAVAKKSGIVHYEFPDNNVVNGETRIFQFLPDGKSTVLYTPLDSKLFNLKLSLFKMYPSQRTLGTYEFSMDKKHFKKFGEPYRVAPDYDYTKPPAKELRYDATSKGLGTIEMFLNAVNDYYANP